MSKTPITDAAELYGKKGEWFFDHRPKIYINSDDMRALEIKYNEVNAGLEIYKNDLAQAAGELMLPLPKPDSDMARVCIANKILKNKIQNLNGIIRDDCDTDSRAREIALKILPIKSVHGDSYGVPTLSDVVEELVGRIESLIECANDLAEFGGVDDVEFNRAKDNYNALISKDANR